MVVILTGCYCKWYYFLVMMMMVFILWCYVLDNSGGEDDAVEAAFFFKFRKAGLGTSSRNAQSSFDRLYVVSDSGFRHVFMVVARRIDN